MCIIVLGLGWVQKIKVQVWFRSRGSGTGLPLSVKTNEWATQNSGPFLQQIKRLYLDVHMHLKKFCMSTTLTASVLDQV